ncbi:MAG: heavy metal response regulator transcription factor [Legionellales bacterium]|nr:heavy metal response regulator transcription factor [Legionellales bacterium]
MRILIIEDEIKTAGFLKKGLVEHGFSVDWAPDGQQGLFLALTENYDLIILDVMLPKLEGWAIVTSVKKEYPHLPLLFLTARDTTEDKVKGLELGADDYLVKPFAFSELLARIRARLRKGEFKATNMISLANLQIDPLRYRVTRTGQRIELTQKEFALLLLLATHQTEVLSRTLIAEKVWDMNFDSDVNTVDVMIRRLRRKVDDPFEPKLIHTVRGVGYVMEIR